MWRLGGSKIRAQIRARVDRNDGSYIERHAEMTCERYVHSPAGCNGKVCRTCTAGDVPITARCGRRINAAQGKHSVGAESAGWQREADSPHVFVDVPARDGRTAIATEQTNAAEVAEAIVSIIPSDSQESVEPKGRLRSDGVGILHRGRLEECEASMKRVQFIVIRAAKDPQFLPSSIEVETLGVRHGAEGRGTDKKPEAHDDFVPFRHNEVDFLTYPWL